VVNQPRLSVLLPTLNGEDDLQRLLPALAQQEIEGLVEWLAVDSSSRDGTKDLLEAAGFQVQVIPREEFSHGPTRNLLASRARGEFLLFLTQDALPTGSDCIEQLLKPLQNPSVAAVGARLVPHPSDDPLTARTVLASPESSGLADVRELSPGQAMGDLKPKEAIQLARFHNVACAYRASVLARWPFPDEAFGEDMAWAALVLDAGQSLAHAPLAEVRHAHRYSLVAAIERYRLDAAFLRRNFGLRVRPGPISMLRGLGHEVRGDWVHMREQGGIEWGSMLRSPFLRGAMVLGQFLGTRGWNLPVGGASTRRYS